MQNCWQLGNTYDISLEHRQFDEDIANYLNKYTNEIVNEIDTNGKYLLDKYDYFYATIKNTNRTQATVLSDFFTRNNGTNTKIAVAYGGIVWSQRDS